MRNAYTIYPGNLKGGDHLGDLGVDENNIKSTLKRDSM
jgi:hypothetical protein